MRSPKTQCAAQFGLRHQDDELFAAVTRDDVGFAGRFVNQLGHRLQHLVAGDVATLIVDGLEMIDVDDRDGKDHLVAVLHRGQRLERIVHRAAIADARQRVGADLGKGHQLVALLADLVVRLGNMRGQLHRRPENRLRLAAKFLPGRFVFTDRALSTLTRFLKRATLE